MIALNTCVYLNEEPSIVLCSVVKHTGSGHSTKEVTAIAAS